MKVGHIYHLIFWDHVAGGDELYKCEVFGRIVSQTKNSVTIGSWLIVGDMGDQNKEVFCILKSAIIQKKVLSKDF